MEGWISRCIGLRESHRDIHDAMCWKRIHFLISLGRGEHTLKDGGYRPQRSLEGTRKSVL